MYDCNGPYDDADNILRSDYYFLSLFSSSDLIFNSVAYDPAELIAYSAWENGNKDTWVPAACSTYVSLDLKDWFARK